MKKIFNIFAAVLLLCVLASCKGFLDEHVPQAALNEDQVKDPENAEHLVVAAYAIFTSAEDINSSFSMWNFDVRSDDAYKGGNGTNDGDVFHQLEIQQGVLTTNWNINDMWVRLYNCISRVNIALSVLESCDESFEAKQQRIAATAELWLMANPTEKQPRFDVIEVYQDEGIVHSIHHIENAF